MGGETDVDPAHRRGTFMAGMLYMVMDLTLQGIGRRIWSKRDPGLTRMKETRCVHRTLSSVFLMQHEAMVISLGFRNPDIKVLCVCLCLCVCVREPQNSHGPRRMFKPAEISQCFGLFQQPHEQICSESIIEIHSPKECRLVWQK